MGIEDPDTRPLIILVSSGYHLYREYLLSSVARAARVWLFLGAEPTWERRYLAGHTVVDTLDADAMIAAAREVQRRHRIDGVLCWDEIRTVPTARLAAAMGVPGGQPDAVGRCRDKHLTRTALDAAGVPQAASALVSDLAGARAAAERAGYPVVLKPRALGASIGVVTVAGPAGLAHGFAIARAGFEDGVPYYDAGILVEEFMAGEEISVDSAIVDGHLEPLFCARKVKGFGVHCEEIGHTVDADDPLLADPALLAVLRGAHAAVGYRNGITHTEVMLTAAGPKIVEINARLGGDLIPYVARVATGIDPGLAAVQVATGVRPDPAPARHRVAAVRFLYPDSDATVAMLELDRAALPAAVETAGVLACPGQRLELPPLGHVTSRYAFVVAHGASAAGCWATTGAAAAAFTLRVVEDELVTSS